MQRRRFLFWCAAASASPAVVAQVGESAVPVTPRPPSATARRAAVIRAVHQVIDAPLVFADPLAVRMVAPVAPAELRSALDGSPGLRADVVLRSRFAEDRLADAVRRGVRQYVNLGAGLDTFACRNPHQAKGLRVFEVDHPATQAFKRQQLKAAGIPVPAVTRFVPVDFETQSLRSELRRAGLRFDRPAFFAMLGVVIYLTREATMETMRVVAGCARGTQIAFSYSVPEEMLGVVIYLTHDAVMETMGVVARCARGTQIAFSYSVPDALLSEAAREARRRAMERVAALGEPWITFYEPEELAARLRVLGFREARSLAPEEANRRYFAGRADALRMHTGHMMLATV